MLERALPFPRAGGFWGGVRIVVFSWPGYASGDKKCHEEIKSSTKIKKFEPFMRAFSRNVRRMHFRTF